MTVKRKPGVTLVEILVSVAILSIVLIGFIIVFAQTTDISRRATREYEATNLAKSRLERARTLIDTNGFSSLTNDEFGETNTEFDLDEDGTNDYRRSTVVDMSFGNVLLTKVDVSVVYKYRGEWKTSIPVTLTTIYVNTE